MGKHRGCTKRLEWKKYEEIWKKLDALKTNWDKDDQNPNTSHSKYGTGKNNNNKLYQQDLETKR